MTDEPNKPDADMEAMLRRWGAEQALQQAPVAPLTMQQPPAEVPPPPRRSWAPLAAAAVVLIAGATMMIWSLARKPEVRYIEVVDTTKVDRLRVELDHVRSQLEKLPAAEAALQDARDKLATAQKHAGELRLEIQKAHDARDAAQRELTATAGKLKDAQQAAGRADTAAQKQIAALKTQLATAEQSTARAESKLAALNKELTAARTQETQATEKYRTAAEQLVMDQSRREQMLRQFAAMYMATAAPDQAGVEAMQTAARKAHMLERVETLQLQAGDAEVKLLLAALEAAFTQLDMLDVHQRDAQAAMFATIADSRIIERIDKALTGRAMLAPDISAYLLEARVILAGGQRYVG